MLCLERRDSEVGGEVEGTETERGRETGKNGGTRQDDAPAHSFGAKSTPPGAVACAGQLVVNGVLTVRLL